MKLKHLTMAVSGFKYDQESGTFTCYGNVKGNIDHAKDRAVDGCYAKSCAQHKADGTMPKMFWSHNPSQLPVGKWMTMDEDEKGLKMTGKLSKTAMGTDIEILAKDGALDSFSIGYIEVKSKWNQEKQCNDLEELDIKEVSWVNFACNEASTLESIKSKMSEKELPTKRELQNLLRDSGLSKSQAETICNHYDPVDDEKVDLSEYIGNLKLFSSGS